MNDYSSWSNDDLDAQHSALLDAGRDDSDEFVDIVHEMHRREMVA